MSLSLGGGGGQTNGAKSKPNMAANSDVVNGQVASATGRLAGPVTWSKLSGSSDLTVNSAGAISSAAGLSPGVSRSVVARGVGADGAAIEVPYTLTGSYVDGGVTTAFLAAMGKTQADYDAVKNLGLKDIQPWAIVGKAVNGPLGGEDISDAYFIKHHNAFVHVTDTKRKQVETSAGVYNWTAPRATDAKFMALVPGVKRAFHMAFGWNQYNPTFVNSGLTSGNLAADITGWIDAIKAEYPNDPFNRIDLVNEPTADTDASAVAWNVQGYQANRGLRSTAFAHQAAGTARDPSDQYKWMRDAGNYMRPLFPTAKLCLLDNEYEVGVPPETYIASMIPGGGNLVRTDGGRNVLMLRAQRLQFIAWDCMTKGFKFDQLGWQGHFSNTAPPNFDYLKSLLWNCNRWGIDPALTEINLVRLIAAGAMPTSYTEDTAKLDRYTAASILFPYLKLFGQHSAITEFTQWNGESTAPYQRQVSTESKWEFPSLTAMKLALRDMVPVANRTLITACRIWGGFSLQDPIKFTVGSGAGVLTTGAYSYINGLTGTGIVLPWTWMNDPTMTRPVSKTDIYMTGQFRFTGTTNAGDKVLMGVGNVDTNASPTDRAYIFGNAQTLKLNMNAAGAGAAAATMATGLALNTLHGFAIRINGTAISYSVNGGAVQTLTASAAMAPVLAGYIMSRPTGADSDPEKQMGWWEWGDGSQVAALGGLAALSTPKVVDVSRPFYDGA